MHLRLLELVGGDSFSIVVAPQDIEDAVTLADAMHYALADRREHAAGVLLAFSLRT